MFTLYIEARAWECGPFRGCESRRAIKTRACHSARGEQAHREVVPVEALCFLSSVFLFKKSVITVFDGTVRWKNFRSNDRKAGMKSHD